MDFDEPGYTCPGGRCQGSRLLSTWKSSGLAHQSRLLADFHELRQDFSPPAPDVSNKP